MNGMQMRQIQRAPEEPLVNDIGPSLSRMVHGLYLAGVLLPGAMLQFRKLYIEAALQECGGNQLHAAARLGMHRNTLTRAIRDLKIDAIKFKNGRGAGPRHPQTDHARAKRVEGGRRGAAATNGRKISTGQGRREAEGAPSGRAPDQSRLRDPIGRSQVQILPSAPSSAAHGQREADIPGASPLLASGVRNSVRKGGRGESQSRHGAAEVASVSSAHLAQNSKSPRGLSFADFQFEDPDLACGGLKA